MHKDSEEAVHGLRGRVLRAADEESLHQKMQTMSSSMIAGRVESILKGLEGRKDVEVRDIRI